VHEQAQNLSVTRKAHRQSVSRPRDGWMVLAVMTDPQFQRLIEGAGCEKGARRAAFRRLAQAHREQQGAA